MRHREHVRGVDAAAVIAAVAVCSAAACLAAGSVAVGAPYADEVARWTAQDALSPSTPGGVVFIGSSSIRRWERLAEDFAEYRVIQRGFGGCRLDHVTAYVNELVLAHSPAAVVLWAGTNDLSAGESAAGVFDEYRAFVAAVHAAQPTVEILFLGVTPTPANQRTTEARNALNAMVRAEAEVNPRTHYVDLPARFESLRPHGAAAFLAMYVDSLHLTRAGYDEWARLVRPALRAVVTPDKTLGDTTRAPGPGDAVLFDLGPSGGAHGGETAGPDTRGNHWNNWHAAAEGDAVNAGEHLAAIVNTRGEATGLRLVITGGFVVGGETAMGPEEPRASDLGALAVGTATRDGFLCGGDDRRGGGDDDAPGGLMLEHLDPGVAYEFRFFGSRAHASERGVTAYHVRGATSATATLRTTGRNIGGDGAFDGNDRGVAVVTGVRPDAFGQVFVDVALLEGRVACLNAMEVRGVARQAVRPPGEGVGPTAPVTGKREAAPGRERGGRDAS